MITVILLEQNTFTSSQKVIVMNTRNGPTLGSTYYNKSIKVLHNNKNATMLPRCDIKYIVESELFENTFNLVHINRRTFTSLILQATSEKHVVLVFKVLIIDYSCPYFISVCLFKIFF